MRVYSHASVRVFELVIVVDFGERRRRRPKIFTLCFTNTSLCFSVRRPNQYSAVVAEGSVGSMAERPKRVAHAVQPWVRTPRLVLSVRRGQFVFWVLRALCVFARVAECAFLLCIACLYTRRPSVRA